MSDEKKQGHGWDAAKLIGVVVTIGTIVFGAGAANEKLKNLETSRAAESEQQGHRERVRSDKYEKLAGAVEALDKRVETLTEEVRRARWQRRGRSRDATPQVDSRP